MIKQVRSVLLMPLLVGLLLCQQVGAREPAFAELQRAAEAGDAWAQLNLGAAYDHGLAGVPRDPSLALQWYRKAAEQGLAKAQFNLAHCLVVGCDGTVDARQARIWMRRAAEQDMADAQFLLGVMLAEGLGGDADRVQARHWLEKAAVRGQADASEYLSKID